MFRKRKKRSSNPLFGLFRLLLSMIMLTALLGGIYSAYRHFSGVDPLKMSPKSITEVVLGMFSQPKIIQDIQDKVSSKVLGKATKAPQEEYKLSNLDIKKDPTPAPVKTRGRLLFKFALIADSHDDSTDLKKALDQIKKDFGDIKFIIGLGDYTDVGTLDELKTAKTLLDGSGFRYFLTAGDHDLWDSRNKDLKPEANFVSVFGPVYQSFSEENFKFIILYNSDNYIGLGDVQKQWLSDQLNSSKDNPGTFVFLHEPLFHPSSDHFMGRVEPKLKTQARDLISQFAKAGVKKVFAGDAHYFSEYEDPESNLSMVTIGAVTLERNLQNPRFGVVSIYDDGSTGVEDVEIK